MLFGSVPLSMVRKWFYRSNPYLTMMELGPILRSYVVRHRRQVPTYDPHLVVEEDAEPDLEEVDTYEEMGANVDPCIICNRYGVEYQLLQCDSCGNNYHMNCIGVDEDPNDQWVCPECQEHSWAPGSTGSRGSRRTAHSSRAWEYLDIDFDLPLDTDHDLSEYNRRIVQQRRWRQQQRRNGQASNTQDVNTTSRYRETAAALSGRRLPTPPPALDREGREVNRAWQVFEEQRTALGEEQTHSSSRRRRSRSRSSSPDRKRQRTGEASGSGSRQTLLDSILMDIRTTPRSNDHTDMQNRASSDLPVRTIELSGSPAASSPAPSVSGHPSPRSMSPRTSPPLPFGSPISSHIGPNHPPAPEIPIENNVGRSQRYHRMPHSPSNSNPTAPPPQSVRGVDQTRSDRRTASLGITSNPSSVRPTHSHSLAAADCVNDTQPGQNSPPTSNSSITNPTRPDLPIETKSVVENIVREVLMPHYRGGLIGSQRFQDINRAICHQFYNEVRQGRPVDSPGAREELQNSAQRRVHRAVHEAVASLDREVKKMVSMALQPRRHDGDIDDQEHEKVHKYVSRLLRERVAQGPGLETEGEKVKWQLVAAEEVGKAIVGLKDLRPSNADGSTSGQDSASDAEFEQALLAGFS